MALGLDSLGSEWTINGVEISKSNSEGLVGEVFVWVDHEGPVDTADVVEVMRASTSELGPRRSWDIRIIIYSDGSSADLAEACHELAEPWALGPSCDRGEISGSASFFIDVVRNTM